MLHQLQLLARSTSRSIFQTMIALAVIFVFPLAAIAAELKLDDAIRIARASNPDFAATAQELTIARAELIRANYLVQFNPEASSDADYRTRQDRSNSQDWRVGLSQQLEIYGQPRLRRESASLNVQRIAATIENEQRLLVAVVKMTFYETLRVRGETQLLGELEALDRKLTQAAQDRYQAGEIGLIDSNLARVRHGEARRALIEGQERYRLERSSLGRLLGGAAGLEPEPAPSAMKVELNAVDPERILDAAMRNRPDLKAAQLELSRLEKESALNRRLALPNPTIGAWGGHDQNTEHFYGLTLGFDIPLFNRRQAEATALAGKLAQARYRFRAVQLNVEREVRDACQRYLAARASVSIEEDDVVTPARDSFNLLGAAFDAGKIDLLSLSLAERQAFEARMGYLAAWFNLAAARVTLELAAGGGA